MSSIRRLTELSTLTAAAATSSDEAVQGALPLLREGLTAEDVFLVYGSEHGFRYFGTCASMDLSDVALWLVHRDLTSRSEPCAFGLRDGRVVDFRSARTRRPCLFIAALIPMPISAGDMIVARGHWPRGLGASSRGFLLAALPTLALLLDRRLDASRAQEQRNRLSALANITRVMSESEDPQTMLSSIAGTIATVTSIDYVSIDILNTDGTVRMRCLNSKQRTQQLADRWKRGASRPDPVRDAVLSTRQPMLFPDAQNDERIPESGRNYFTRTLIRSTAVFPLLVKDEALGVLSVASHRPREFSPAEVELLEGLSAQVATAVKGIQLYQELDESRRQLQESMGVQHHLARTDTLTGIPNRRFIDETVEAESGRARRYDEALSVVVADLDDLKQVNDTYGHEGGDDVLKFAAGIARESCRQVDVVGRYGGDEFVFVLPSTQLQDAAAFAERFRQRLAETPVPIRDGDSLRLTISLGVAQWDSESMEEPASLIRQADRVMYQSKAAGGNRTMVAEGDTARAA